MLGVNMGEFYYELAVKVAEVCRTSRSRNGGIISVSEVRTILMKRKAKFRFALEADDDECNEDYSSGYSNEDILTAIQKLSKLGSGFRTVKVGNTDMVVSVPTELDNDHMEVMRIAKEMISNDKDIGNSSLSEEGNGITVEDVATRIGWKEQRAHRALVLLLGEGMLWLDRHDGKEYYWFPSLWKENLI